MEGAGGGGGPGKRTVGGAGAATPPPGNTPPTRHSKEPRRGPRSKHSPYRGVTCYKRTGRWEAHIWEGGKQLHLGSFDTAEEAGKAYDRAVIVCRGLSSVTNFPAETYAENSTLLRHTKGELSKEAALEELRESSRRRRGQTARQLKKKQRQAEIAAEKAAKKAQLAAAAAATAAKAATGGPPPSAPSILDAAALLQQLGGAHFGPQAGLSPQMGPSPLAGVNFLPAANAMQLKWRPVPPGGSRAEMAPRAGCVPSTRFRGVVFDSADGLWHASVPVGCQEFPAGSGQALQYECEGAFQTEIAAAQAYDSVALRVHGGLAPVGGQSTPPALNFPVARQVEEEGEPPPPRGR